MGGRYTNPTPQYFDDNGVPLAGGILYFSENGAPWSTNPQAVYSDAALTVPMTSVTLDSAGRCPNIFASYQDTYRVVLKTSAGVTVWTKDNVQFADAQELVTLAAQLQAQIDSIETVILNSNPISNPTTEAIVAGVTSVTLTNSFLPHVAVGIDGRVSGTVSAGTMQSGTLSGLGSTSRQAKMAGVTGDSSSIVEWRFRVASAEARRFANETLSISAVMRQESGLTATATIALYKADAADNFSAVTLVGSTTASVTSSTNTTLTYAGVSAGDVSNGIELVIKCQPGGAFSTKDFYLTDIKVEVGATATDFSAPSYVEIENEARAVGLGVFRDTGTTNAIAISTRQAVSLYDGLTFVVYRTATNTAALTLAVDNSSAITVVRTDGKACRAGDTVSGSYYRFRYDATNSRFILENPEIRKLLITANGFVDLAVPGSPVVYGYGVTSVTRASDGYFTVTLSDTYKTDTKIRMFPVVISYHDGPNPNIARIYTQTATTFDVKFENNSSVGTDPSTGFFFQVTGELNA